MKFYNKQVLPQEGYLCKYKINLDSKHKDKSIITLIRGKEKTHYSPSDQYIKYENRIENSRELNLRKIGENKNITLGDPITTNDEWPRPKKRKIVRIIFHNVAGFSTSDNIYESHLYNQDLMKYQSDITCLTELNINLNNNKMRNSIINMFKFTDRHAKIQLGIQPENLRSAHLYYPGGNLISTQGCLAGRIIKKGADQIGRWSWMELKCNHMKNIIVISAYRTNGNVKGEITIAAQECRQHIENKEKNPHLVREHFMNDMSVFIDSIHNNDKLVLLMMDANEDFKKKRIESFCNKLGLKNIHSSRMNSNQIPNTFIRGQNCIDLALCSIELIPCVEAAGYLPFESIGTSDHRPIYVDLSCNYLFSNVNEDNTKKHMRTMTTKKLKILNKYILTLKDLFQKASLGEKVRQLKDDFENCTTTNLHLQKRMNKYDKTRKELMICALKRCNPMFGHKQWSPRMKR